MTATHKRSIHIDAPVEKVFDYYRDMRHLFESFSEDFRRHSAVAEVHETPEGVGSTATIMGRVLLLFHGEWTARREEFVPNERIVDRVPLGKITSTFQPADPAGTTLTVEWDWAPKVPLVGEVIDRVSWGGDEELDELLANIKKAVES